MIKKYIKRSVVRHPFTTILGTVCLLLGLVVMKHTYVETNTFSFNVFYVWPGAFALLAVGFLGLCAADHKE